MYWILAGILTLLTLFAIAIIPHNVRVMRARRAFRRVPSDVVERVFGVLRDAANRQASVTLLRPMPDNTCDAPTASYIGGYPYAESDDTWPRIDSNPATFLMQVRLDDAGLPDPWRDRLVQVFLAFDLEQIVRSYDSPNEMTNVSLRPSTEYEPVDCVPLQHTRIPEWRDTEESASWSAQLLEDAPEIRQLLTPFGRDTEGILTQILCPRVYGYSIAESDTAFVGGKPVLIQNAHEPVCEVCGARMRFLFQFGEVIPKMQLADGGICYVYGCDEHPHSCKGYIDSH